MLSPRALLATLTSTWLALSVAGCASSPVPSASGDGGSGSTTTGSTTTQSNGTGGSGGAGGAATGLGGQGGAGQGGAGEGGALGCQKAGETVLAVDHLFVGDTDMNMVASSQAWKQFGLNLDGKVSTNNSADLCQPASGASKNSVYPDGDNGIDNAFGKLVLPVLLGINPDFANMVNSSIDQGTFSILVALEGLKPGNDQSPIEARVYTGSSTDVPPAFDGRDCWPVTAESLSDPKDTSSAKVVFPASALDNSSWTSSGESTINLTVPSFPDAIHLRVRRGRMAMNLATDHESAIAGEVGGVLDTEEFVAEVTRLAGLIDKSLCGSATLDSILAQVRQASDILNDGTQDPAKTCNGISIGFGFTMARVGLGGVAAPIVPQASPCGG